MGKVKYPCRNCIYKTACGSSTRTEPCDGRMNKREKESALKLARQKFMKGE